MAKSSRSSSTESPGTTENRGTAQGAPPQSDVTLKMPIFNEIEGSSSEEGSVDYRQRGQWLRAAVLGANDGLVSTASLMMGIGAVKQDARAMVLSGLAGLVAGACSMAIGEFVSVYSQIDIQLSDIKRKNALEPPGRSWDREQSVRAYELHGSSSDHSDNSNTNTTAIAPAPNSSSSAKMQAALEKLEAESDQDNVNDLPNPIQAASASAISFSMGALVPLLSAAFIKEHWVRVGVVVSASSLALATFGAAGAYIGRSSMLKASLRVLLGGWAAMLLTFGMLRLFGSTGI